MSPICNQIIVSYNPLVLMLIVEVDSNDYDASTLRNISIEYHRILQNTQLFSNLHKMEGK
jgi:hypothetical protein